MVNLNKKSKDQRNGKRDFLKAKTRIGRLKPGAVNATDTKVTSRHLKLSEQALSTAQKVEKAALHRHLTTDSLLAQLAPHLSQVGHYQVNTRRDAVLSILTKCRNCQPQDPVKKELSMTMGTLLNAVVNRTIIDEDSTVRANGRQLFSFLLSIVPQASIPFLEGWLGMVQVATTHLNPQIKKDVALMVEGALRVIPTLLTPHLGQLLYIFAVVNEKDTDLQRPREGYGRNKKANTSWENLMSLLVEFFLLSRASALSSSVDDGTGKCFVYQWQPVQRINVSRVRLRSTNCSTDLLTCDPLSQNQTNAVIKWFGNRLLSTFLEALPYLKRGDNHDDSVESLRKWARQFMTFLQINEIDWEDVGSTLPKAIQTIDFRELLRE